jgi:histone H3/H4
VRLRGLLHEEVAPFIDHAMGKHTAQRFSPEALSVIFEQARAIPAIVISHASLCLDHHKNTKTVVDKQAVVDLLESIDAT